ncbi:MAG: hypothetical protein N3I86_12535 [Verrucomicrobiae bacterium]|nr:hypothetical protein [Verrucomicrobiae bacterium]MDW8309930.1 hypothetical protein [Verrucomicrobiales bacterium]
MRYRHTQFGWITVGICGAIVLIFALCPTPARAPREWVFSIPAMVLGILVLLFGTLTVEVDDERIRLWFGIGLVRKTIPLADIASCRPVRNRWWWGWGIRAIPGGWLYNVSGLDAVELVLRNGRIFRIGTDEPQRLWEFIEARRSRVI